MSIKSILGSISVLVAIIGYIPYIRNILIGKTKPHALSWLVWAALSAIAFAVQVINNGGPGAWLLGVTAAVTLSIFLMSLKKGETSILLVDWLSLLLAVTALLLWFFTKNPLASIVLISITDMVGGFFPTFRKSFHKPHQETISLYLIYALSILFSLAALRRFDIINVLYPATFVLVNLCMVIFLYVRRRQLSSHHHPKL